MKHPPEIVPAWPTKRMRYLVRKRPTAEQLSALNSASDVTFLPMDAVGDSGAIDLSHVRPKESVEQGYTLFFENDVLIAKITPCFENGKGAVARGLLNGVGYGTTELFVLDPSEQLDEDFLYYVTYSTWFRHLGEAEMTGAAGQKRVTSEFISDFRVPVPPVEEQRRIAGFLDRETAQIDALIAAKERVLSLLTEKRQSLITHAVTRGLNPNAPLRESGMHWIGQIPLHWKLHRLKFHMPRIEQGWSPQCDSFPAEDDEWGVLKVGAVNGWEFNPLDNKRLPLDLEPLTDCEIKDGDILMSRANTTLLVGKAALVRSVRPRLIFCDKHYRLSINTNTLDAEFLVLFLRSTAGHFEFERDATGASNSMQNIGQDSVKNVWITLPPKTEQIAVVKHLSATLLRIDDMDAANRRTVSLLRERRSALIAAAVTGQLKIEG